MKPLHRFAKPLINNADDYVIYSRVEDPYDLSVVKYYLDYDLKYFELYKNELSCKGWSFLFFQNRFGNVHMFHHSHEGWIFPKRDIKGPNGYERMFETVYKLISQHPEFAHKRLVEFTGYDHELTQTNLGLSCTRRMLNNLYLCMEGNMAEDNLRYEWAKVHAQFKGNNVVYLYHSLFYFLSSYNNSKWFICNEIPHYYPETFQNVL